VIEFVSQERIHHIIQSYIQWASEFWEFR